MTHGMSNTRLYRIWSGMKSRTNPATTLKIGKHYAGRGIVVCQEWAESFEAFRDWALANGYRDDLTIDREENDGPYSPDNCRWVTQKVQANNKRTNIYITRNGVTKTLKQWCEDLGLNYDAERKRSRRRSTGMQARETYLSQAEQNRILIRQAIAEYPQLSIRALAEKTGYSKSAIHRELTELRKQS